MVIRITRQGLQISAKARVAVRSDRLRVSAQTARKLNFFVLDASKLPRA